MSKRRREDDDPYDDDRGVIDDVSGSDYEPADIASPASEDGEIEQDSRYHDKQQPKAAKHYGRLPPIDEEYGQRLMFDADQLRLYDSDQEVEDTDPVTAYLKQVNSERRALPQLLNSTDREAEIVEEQAEGEDHRGRFVDGYYAVEPTKGPRRPVSKDEAYYDSIIAGYQAVRDILGQPWSMDEMIELSKYGYLSLRFEEPCPEHRANLARVILPLHTPREIEMKYMEAQTAWYILTSVLRLIFALEEGKPISTNVGAWIYFLLARVEPVQAQMPENVSDLRELAQLLVQTRNAVSEGLQAEEFVSAPEVSNNYSPTQAARRRLAQQSYLETCQIVDTILIIIGVYYRQRDLLDLREPLPNQTFPACEATTEDVQAPTFDALQVEGRGRAKVLESGRELGEMSDHDVVDAQGAFRGEPESAKDAQENPEGQAAHGHGGMLVSELANDDPTRQTISKEEAKENA